MMSCVESFGGLVGEIWYTGKCNGGVGSRDCEKNDSNKIQEWYRGEGKDDRIVISLVSRTVGDLLLNNY